jgi:hypothetical protein
VVQASRLPWQPGRLHHKTPKLFLDSSLLQRRLPVFGGIIIIPVLFRKAAAIGAIVKVGSWNRFCFATRQS